MGGSVDEIKRQTAGAGPRFVTPKKNGSGGTGDLCRYLECAAGMQKGLKRFNLLSMKRPGGGAL
jgi:hypothetical protein